MLFVFKKKIVLTFSSSPRYSLWIFKVTILEFFKRITGVSWERSYETTLLFIRITLALTFLAIVISDLSECQPFAHYWQVLPDPGGQCRQGYVQLLTMAVCNVLTDLLLVFFPIPIIIRSHMSVKRKIQLVLLFSLSLSVVGVTIYRVPHIIDKQGRQQARSLFASVELLFATAAANALVLGSFVRDRGVKKRKYRHGSVMDSIDQSSGGSRSRRPTVRQWGSDEDLVRDLGLGVNPELRDMPDSPGMDAAFHPAPLAKMAEDMSSWQFSNGRKRSGAQSEDTLFVAHDQVSRSNSAVTPRRVSFLDAGNLLGGGGDDQRRDSYLSGVDPLSTQTVAAVAAAPPPPAVPAGGSGFRRGSQALLQDLGGLLTPSTSRSQSAAHQGSKNRGGSGGGGGGTEQLPSVPDESPHESQYLSHDGRAEMVLMDPGGLLGPSKK